MQKLIYSQTEPGWCNTIMTSRADLPRIDTDQASQRWPSRVDTIGACGCLVTALCNAHNVKAKSGELTPWLANEVIRKNRGYMVQQKKESCPIGQESFLTDTAYQLFGVSDIDRYFGGAIDIHHPEYYYLARVPYSPMDGIMSGHYNLVWNVVGGQPVHLDSETGAFRTDWGDSSLYWISRIRLSEPSQMGV